MIAWLATTPARGQVTASDPPAAPVPPPAPAPYVPTAGPVPAAPPEPGAPDGDPTTATPTPTPAPPPPAPAPPSPAPFGSRGQLVLTSGLGFVSTSDDATTISLAPNLDGFVGGAFSLGGGIGYARESFTNNAQPTVSTWRISLRVGVNLAVADRLSFWPLISTSSVYPSQSPSYFLGQLNLPLLLHLAPHFFVAGGPFVSTLRPLGNDAALNASRTSEGLLTFIGGWW